MYYCIKLHVRKVHIALLIIEVQGFYGAELQNVLKLFGALIEGTLATLPTFPIASKGSELIIY